MSEIINPGGGSSGGLTVGTTTITDGTPGYILYDNNGVLGEKALPASLTLTDGVHTVTAVAQITVTGGTVGGSTPNATLTITASASAPGQPLIIF